MKQILQNLSNGETSIVDVPCPKNINGSLLIETRQTLISAGTERMLIDFGKAGYLEKARKQPDKVKQVLNKIQTDGLLTTIDAVRSKLDQPLPLGYCNAGVVLESSVSGFAAGDRVVSNGYHAEVVRVAKNLCARIPDEVDDDSAAFTVLAAIGLQGIRLINPTLGETIVVSGLGLIGLLCVQMLRANGCRVIGIDFDSHRCALARKFGADVINLSEGQDPVSEANLFTRGQGVDGVLISASSPSDEIMHQSAEMCRKRGRIVLVGVVGLNLNRDDFFKKEITFQVSASYGPGRYDPLYEEAGQDYPLGFVRWTEQRNFEAVLELMASGALDVKPLVSHRYSIDEALEAYALVGDSSALGILLNFPGDVNDSGLRLQSRTTELATDFAAVACHSPDKETLPVLGFIGAGNYSSRTLIPAFKAAGSRLDTIVTSAGVSGVHHGTKAGFITAATDTSAVWNNSEINTAVIVTRHDSHASLVVEAIKSGKHVFVEKPLCLTLLELEEIDQAYRQYGHGNKSGAGDASFSGLLMVGFNRRFAPHVVRMKALVSARNQPKTVIITVNAGEIPSDHWTQDRSIGGGRIIGEGCHFIDLMRFLIGARITGHQATMIGQVPGIEVRDDKVSISLTFADGSFGTIHYLANGGKVFPKERVEVFCGGSVLQLDNYRILRSFGWQGFKSLKLWRQDKGQKTCARAFLDAIRQGKSSPIPYEEVMEVSRISIEIAEALRQE